MTVEDEDGYRDLQRRMLEAIQQVVGGSDFAPDGAALVTEAVVIMGWVDSDGDCGTSHLRCGTTWGTEGLVVQCLRRMETCDEDDEP